MRHALTDNYFETIDTHEKAYWLGFLYADGYIATKAPWTVICQIKDIDHLTVLKANVQFSGPISKPKRFGGYTNSSPMGRITLCRKQLCVDLANKNCASPKTTLPTCPDEFKSSMVRGVFDGDGSISVYNRYQTIKGKRYGPYQKATVSIILHESATQQMIDILNKIKIKSAIANSKTSYMKYVTFSAIPSVTNFAKWIYSQPGPFLERKYNTFTKISAFNGQPLSKTQNMLETP